MLVLSPFYKNKVRGWDISYIGRLFTKHNQICWGVKNNKKKSKTSSSLRPKSHDGLIYDNDMDWIIILKRYNNLPGKPCLVTILFRNEELINIMFRKDSSSASPFLHRCLRSILMWMLACPVNCNLTSAMVILDKKDTFSKVWNPMQDTILKDIQLMICNFVSFSFCSFEEQPWAKSQLDYIAHNADPHVLFYV